MPRERRSTSATASAVLAYGHMRQPPAAGPRAVEWMAMIALSPVAASWPNTTCSWASNSRRSKISIGTA